MRRTPTRMLRGRVKRGEDLDRSDALLVRALAHGLPEGTTFVVGRAIGYQRSARLDRARKLVSAAQQARPQESLAPGNAGAFASLGVARLCLGDRAGAREAFSRSLSLDPGQPKVKQYLAQL